MDIFKQFSGGRWFAFWTKDKKETYTVLDTTTMKHLTGPDPQQLIKDLLKLDEEPAKPKKGKKS